MRICWTLVMGLALCAAPAGAAERAAIRPAVGAGSFYPAQPGALYEKLQALYAGVETNPAEGRLVGIIAPVSGYKYSGKVAAAAFKELKEGQYERVILLVGSHYATFEGCSIAGVDAYSTPLGIVPLDREIVGRLSYSPLISIRSLRFGQVRGRVQLHEREHAIEVLLPFLQERLRFFRIVPIVVGRLNDAKGAPNEQAVEAVARTIGDVVDEDTLIVVGTDFTHFGNDFSYRPFRENIPESIERLDRRAFAHIVKHDYDGFMKYLDSTENTICGKEALRLFLKLVPRRTMGLVNAYQQSGQITGNENRSVSYAALHFYDPVRPPAPSRSVNSRLVFIKPGETPANDAEPVVSGADAPPEDEGAEQPPEKADEPTVLEATP